jgi:hypothetical protein
VIIGAVAGKYRKIYKGVARLAKHSRIPCISADMYIKSVKQVYERVWRRLELSSVELDAVKAELPHDLWDAEVPLEGPKAFGLRVFRRQNIIPGRHSWYQRKYAMARQKNRRHR